MFIDKLVDAPVQEQIDDTLGAVKKEVELHPVSLLEGGNDREGAGRSPAT